MHIRRFLLAGLALAAAVSSAEAGVRLGIGIGVGVPCYGPYYRPYGYYGYPYPYYYPPPVVVAPPPVVMGAPAPVVAGSAPAAVPAPPPPPVETVPPPALTPPPTVRGVRADSNSMDLTALNDPTPQARAEASIRLGRNRDTRAVPSLVQVLRDDTSPTVREAAARALGLIALPASLSALQNAAQGDDDRDVRRSASFAAEVIRANMRR